VNEPNLDRVSIAQIVLALILVGATAYLGWRLLPDPEPSADQVNRAVVNELRDHPSVMIVDQHSDFEVEEMTDDGLHPNAEGSQQMALVWADALARSGRRPTDGETVSIMPLGDSITAWAYRDRLAALLVLDGWNFDMVGSISGGATTDGGPGQDNIDLDHEGHTGWSTLNILEGHPDEPDAGRLDEWIDGADPDVVLLHIGTNDLFRTEDGAKPIANRVRQIVDDIVEDRPDRLVLVAEIIPFESGLIDIYIEE